MFALSSAPLHRIDLRTSSDRPRAASAWPRLPPQLSSVEATALFPHGTAPRMVAPLRGRLPARIRHCKLTAAHRLAASNLSRPRFRSIGRANHSDRARPRPQQPMRDRMPSTSTRTETDSFGPIEVPADAYWGAQTERSIEQFPVRPARADAGRDRPRAGLHQAGCGAGECADRRARPEARRSHPAGGRARSRAAISTASSRWSSGRPARARSRT